MDECPECGSHDLQVSVVDGAAVRECGLCGARFGDPQAVESLQNRDEAARHGFDGEVWPLVRLLQRLRGVLVDAGTGGDEARRQLPAVRLVPGSASFLTQLENLATSMRLGAAALHREWVIEVESGRHLTFVLRPRAPAQWSPTVLRDARLDLETLRRHIERDMRLSWWHHEASSR